MNMLSRKRFPNLIYRRAVDRLWPLLFIIGVLLTFIWAWNFLHPASLFSVQYNLWFLGTTCLTIVLSLFIFISRYLAYVQVQRNYLKLVTPFLRLHISFHRIHRFHPTDFVALFPPTKLSWTKRNFLAPFYGRTAVVVELYNYPIAKPLLRIFFAPQMFLPDSTGLILLVPDWMAFSTELDTYWARWQQTQRQRPPLPGSLR
jgi:hypothetical protein